MMGNPVDAEDMTQDVFIQLYRKIGSFRGEAAFTTWLHRLTVNQVLMHFRKRGVRLETATDDHDMRQVSELETNRPLPMVDHIALEQAIAQLPTGYRTIFVLHDIEGYEHEEVAKMLGCSVGTSKSQLHKARMRLRQILRSKE
jgi:RNA polymerase sigma-70 factor (ECF subfamily)